MFGNESADAGNYQVPIRVAHALGRPCVTGVKAISRRWRERPLRAGGRGRARRLRRAPAGGRERQGGAQPAALPVGAGAAAGQAQAAGRGDSARAESRLEMVRLKLPPGSGKQVEVLGHGAEAAPAVVEVLRELGWCR